ncbi:MAG TPA: 3-methyl-2-oxobutanoate hydroxymethyltransferase, partial [Fibrobacteria bacterium]|nr:3-methyl-2-oxobutanoate hydroxymethyltransferase [Fibrobacteria bacterium]
MNAQELFDGFRRPAPRPLSMVTAYDSTFAAIVVQAGVDAILVGDSLANTMLGMGKTAQVGMKEMLHHLVAVRRGAPGACVLIDLPFGADSDPEAAVANSRLLVEAGADGVKLEGCVPRQVRAIRAAGIAVMGHLGLQPQTATSFKQTGRTDEDRERILREAKTMEEAGCCAIVLEHIPSDLGTLVTESLRIPTIGIGAGPGCGGQVLVLHDLLGLSARQPPFAPARVNLRAIA